MDTSNTLHGAASDEAGEQSVTQETAPVNEPADATALHPESLSAEDLAPAAPPESKPQASLFASENKPAESTDEYARNPDGSIKYRADGITPAKKRGRRSGTAAKASEKALAKVAPENGAAEFDDGMIIANATALVQSATGLLAAVIGPEWNATPEEEKLLATAGAAYMRSQNAVDISPGVALAIIASGFAIKRIAQNENTATKLKVFAVRAWSFIRKIGGF